MLSKRESKYFKSLQLKKYRQSEKKFLVEGAKGVEEALNSDFLVETLMGTSDYLNTLSTDLKGKAHHVLEAKESDLVQIGTFKSNKTGIAVLKMVEDSRISTQKEGVILALESINDPGNLGTIIRIADWYGINQIVCSEDTADFYNPKVINATMGSFTRVRVSYLPLKEYLQKSEAPIYGAVLEGNSIYEAELGNGVILMGSESHGISSDLRNLITHPIRIPGSGGAESLNVAVATAVILDNFARY